MGLFGDKLVLNLSATSNSSKRLQINVEKSEKIPHLFPFSCISLISSQLTVLTSYHPKTLCLKVLDYIEKPVTPYKVTNIITGFNLELYKASSSTYYNQFKPKLSSNPVAVGDDLIQTDIEDIMIDYLITIHDSLGLDEAKELRAFLLMVVLFYQQMLIPIISQINIYDLEQRKKLAKTIIDFCSSVYQRWGNASSILPGSENFIDNMQSARNFSSYIN